MVLYYRQIMWLKGNFSSDFRIQRSQNSRKEVYDSAVILNESVNRAVTLTNNHSFGNNCVIVLGFSGNSL